LLEREGIGRLQEELFMLDPGYAATVDLHNPARLIRALEVCRTTGMPYSSFRTNMAKNRGFRIRKLGLELPKEMLYQRINDRVDRMMEAGLQQEAMTLFPLQHLAALNTVGYKELFGHFEGRITLEEAVEKIKTHSRRYAKRQLTWFRKDPDYHWFRPDELEKEISNGGIQLILQRGMTGSL
jgi:tRNA dimethylallyltransferase